MSHVSISPSVSLSALFSELASGTLSAPSAAGLTDALAPTAEVAGLEKAVSEVASKDAGVQGDKTGAAGAGRSHSAAFDTAFGHAANPSALQALAQADGRPAHSPTLQDMAQAVPRHDIAAERHGSSTASGSARPLGTPGAPAPQGADRAAPQASWPTARPGSVTRDAVIRGEAQLTQAPLSMLHLQPPEFRSRFTGPDEKEEAHEDRHDRGGHRSSHSEDESDPHGHDGEDAGLHDGNNASAVGGLEDDDLPDAIGDAAGTSGPLAASATSSAAGVPPSDDHGAASSTPPFSQVAGDASLYQQIVGALHASAASHPEVAELLEELRRQRRVVLATPGRLTTGLRCDAHVDVLWPLPGGGRALRLSGELLWAQAGHHADWRMAHLVKTQAGGSVRQLAPLASAEPQDARCIAVCLGAQATPMVAWSHACLRVRDATRLWQALEPQWSLRLLVGTLPLSLQTPGSAPQHPHGRPPHVA